MIIVLAGLTNRGTSSGSGKSEVARGLRAELSLSGKTVVQLSIVDPIRAMWKTLQDYGIVASGSMTYKDEMYRDFFDANGKVLRKFDKNSMLSSLVTRMPEHLARRHDHVYVIEDLRLAHELTYLADYAHKIKADFFHFTLLRNVSGPPLNLQTENMKFLPKGVMIDNNGPVEQAIEAIRLHIVRSIANGMAC